MTPNHHVVMWPLQITSETITQTGQEIMSGTKQKGARWLTATKERINASDENSVEREWWRKVQKHHGRDTDRARKGRGRQLVTSKRWELTFFPFFIHVIRGLGSPAAWHTKDATPPEIPVWSSGDLIKFGKPREGRWKEERRHKKRERERENSH